MRWRFSQRRLCTPPSGPNWTGWSDRGPTPGIGRGLSIQAHGRAPVTGAWETGGTAPAQAPEKEILVLAGAELIMCAVAIDRLAALRDADQDEEADELLISPVTTSPACAVVALHTALEHRKRSLDANRLLTVAAARCDASQLRQLASNQFSGRYPPQSPCLGQSRGMF